MQTAELLFTLIALLPLAFCFRPYVYAPSGPVRLLSQYKTKFIRHHMVPSSPLLNDDNRIARYNRHIPNIVVPNVNARLLQGENNAENMNPANHEQRPCPLTPIATYLAIDEQEALAELITEARNKGADEAKVRQFMNAYLREILPPQKYAEFQREHAEFERNIRKSLPGRQKRGTIDQKHDGEDENDDHLQDNNGFDIDQVLDDAWLSEKSSHVRPRNRMPPTE